MGDQLLEVLDGLLGSENGGLGSERRRLLRRDYKDLFSNFSGKMVRGIFKGFFPDFWGKLGVLGPMMVTIRFSTKNGSY